MELGFEYVIGKYSDGGKLFKKTLRDFLRNGARNGHG